MSFAGYGKWEKLGEVIANTNVIRYLMAAMGILGVIAKLVNQVTLNRLIRAAGTMSKSTHRLIKLVKAKYEHACMVHDTVENTDAFVEKYIYEYRGFLFKIHTWRQIEILTVWFSGILALSGASADYLYYGAVESVYQYIAVGAAEMILLEVIRRMSDEPYKIQGVKMYMIDYLDNTCAVRQRRQRVTEKEELNVIASANYGAAEQPVKKEETVAAKPDVKEREKKVQNRKLFRKQREEPVELPINIEGEPRRVEPQMESGTGYGRESGETGSESVKKTDSIAGTGVNAAAKAEARQAVREVLKELLNEEDKPALREEAIRQILEEFLA